LKSGAAAFKIRPAEKDHHSQTVWALQMWRIQRRELIILLGGAALLGPWAMLTRRDMWTS